MLAHLPQYASSCEGEERNWPLGALIRKSTVYYITAAEITNEMALEAFVHTLKPCIRILGQWKNRRHSQAKVGSLLGSRTCFRCMKEGKVEAQPQFSSTYYLLVRIALPGQQRAFLVEELQKASSIY